MEKLFIFENHCIFMFRKKVTHHFINVKIEIITGETGKKNPLSVAGNNQVSYNNNVDINKKKIFNNVKSLIGRFGWVLATVIGTVGLRDVVLDFMNKRPLLTANFSDFFLKAILALYLFSWVVGCIQDLDHEDDVLVVEPNNGELNVLSISLMIVIVVAFAGMCLSEDIHRRVLFIDLLFAFDAVIGWLYLKKFIKKAIDDSENAISQRETFGDAQLVMLKKLDLYKIHAIKHYLYGDWKTLRVCCGGVVLVVLNISAFTCLGSTFGDLLKIQTNDVYTFFIFIFLLIMEMFIWYFRLRKKFIFEGIKSMKDEME